MTETTTPKTEDWKEAGAFSEVFWKFDQQKVLEGIFAGVIEKKMKRTEGRGAKKKEITEDREFARVVTDPQEKPAIAGGRDILNKIQEVPVGSRIIITFEKKDTFSPADKPTLKVPINRYTVKWSASNVEANLVSLCQIFSDEDIDRVIEKQNAPF